MKEIRFDDITKLREEISEEFSTWSEPPLIVTQEMINTFAELTGDHQWIHVDVERAKSESPFGGPIAHGFLTLSLTPLAYAASSFTVTNYGNGANYGIEGLRFLAPVPAGSAIHGRTRLIEVHQRKTGTLLTREVAIHVVGSVAPALVYKWKVLYQPKPS
mgnify:CR=1 FL=1